MAFAVAFALFLLPPRPALSSKPRCRLERVAPATPGGDQLQALASVVELEGAVDGGRPPSSFRLELAGQSLGPAEKAVSFERSNLEADVVLAVEVSALYAPALDSIKEALHDFVESLPSRIKVKLVLFGTDLDVPPSFVPAPAVSPAIDDINPDDEGEVQLVNGIRAGLKALIALDAHKGVASFASSNSSSGAAGKLPPRKLIVVLSDGINPMMDRKTFRQLGDDLRKSDVALFPIAFSPRDDRGPLLNLGELAKRTAGTFRWAPNAEALKEQFASLSEELRGLQVLTFSQRKIEASCLPGTQFQLVCGDLKSNEFTVPGRIDENCGGTPWWHWVLRILGGIAGLWLIARGAVFLLSRKAPRPPGQAPLQVPPVPPWPGGPPAQPIRPAMPAMPAGPILPASTVATLVMIGGRLGGQRIQVPFKLIIGKAAAGPGTLTVADDPSLGPLHGEIQRDQAGFLLVDYGTPGGSFVNDRRIGGPTRLSDGDLVRLGAGTQFKFRLD